MKHHTIVIKLGTSSLFDEVTRSHRVANMSLIVETVVRLKKEGHRVVIVSSGGIAAGLKRMKMTARPKKLAQVQAIASLGQARLIGIWEDLFRRLDQPIAQILLTRNDIADRSQYLNAVNTLNELLHLGVVPIVNENDTLSAYEIKFGDNDTLSAVTAAMLNADYLFLMTDVSCLYTDNPRANPDAKPLIVVEDINALRDSIDFSSAGSAVGTGGMATKIIAADLATIAGVTTVICKSDIPGSIPSIIGYIEQETGEGLEAADVGAGENSETPEPAGENGTGSDGGPLLEAIDPDTTELKTVDPSSIDLHAMDRLPIDVDTQPLDFGYRLGVNVPLHTRFMGMKQAIRDRQFWILHGRTTKGVLYVDKGAAAAISRPNRAGLLPAGIKRVEGVFHTSEVVDIIVDGQEEDGPIGRAIVNYSSGEIERIKGIRSTEIQQYLGYADTEYVAHRDNIGFNKGPVYPYPSQTNLTIAPNENVSSVEARTEREAKAEAEAAAL